MSSSAAKSSEKKSGTSRFTEPFRNLTEDINPYREQMPTSLMGRTGFGKAGKLVNVNINSHIVKAFPNNKVYQYDVSFKPLGIYA